MEYRRATTPGGTYFFTVVTHQRKPLFSAPSMVAGLRKAVRMVKSKHPFSIDAMVVLPDHLHCLWTLPPGDANFSTRWRLIKSNVSRICPNEWKGDRTPSRNAKKEQAVWQRRFWEHQIRDDQDMNNHINYIHYNPIHHCLVQHLKDWPYSSFHKYVKNGQYDPNWGSEYSLTFDADIGHE